MSIIVRCPGCAKSLKAPPTLAGKRVKCPNCQTAVAIPTAASSATAVPGPRSPGPGGTGQSSTGPRATVPRAPTAPPPRPAKTAVATAAAPAAPQPRPAAPPLNPLLDELDFSAIPRVKQTDLDEFRLAPLEPSSTAPPPPRPLLRTVVSTAPEPARGSRPAHGAGGNNRLYVLFSLTLLPLALLVVSTDDMADRVEKTLRNNPELAERFNEATSKDAQLTMLPGRRIEGALLSGDSWMHWLFAIVSTGAFLWLIVTLFERGTATINQLLVVGVFTATGGIFCLLILQFIAELTQRWIVTGVSILTLIFYIFKFFGWLYYAAMDPGMGFWVSLLGFTLGVGLCEEITKALPVIFRCGKSEPFDWRGACVLGLASGVGFGVAEGILYSTDYYNGIFGGGIYLVRFVSCVGLHSVWGASVGIMVYYTPELRDSEDWSDFVVNLLKIACIPMLLHGLYNTLLKNEMAPAAFGVALISFVWLIGLIETSRRDESVPQITGAA